MASVINHNYQCQTSNISKDVNEVNYVVSFLPVSSSLAAGFEEVEKSLRTLLFKLDNLAERETEKDGDDSSVTRISAKALQRNHQIEETEVIIPTTTSIMSLSDDGSTNKETISLREGKEEKDTASICRGNVEIISGKKKMKPFIAGSRIPQRPWSSDTLLVPMAPIHKDTRREACHLSTKSVGQSEGRSPIAPVLSRQNSSSNLSTSLTSLLFYRSNEEMDSVANKLSFITSASEFEPTLQLPLDLSANILYDDEERLKLSIRNVDKREIYVKYGLDDVKQIEQKRFDSSEVNTTSLSSSSSIKQPFILPQLQVSNLSHADSSVIASVRRINLPMSSIRAQVSLQQSRRLVFESLGQLSEIEENSSSSNKRILGDLPHVSELLSSTNESVMTTFPTPVPFPDASLHPSLSSIIRPSSSYDSQQSVSLKRSIAASLTLLPTQDEILKVEGHLKRDSFYGDLIDEIHAKEMLFSLRHSSRETSESSSSAKMSNNEMERAELTQEVTPQSMASAYNYSLLTMNLSSKHLNPESFIPSFPIHAKVDNTRTEALLSRSNAILQDDHQQREMKLCEGSEQVLNTQRIKRELEKWLCQPPLLEQPTSDDVNHNFCVSLNNASQRDPTTSDVCTSLSEDRGSINATPSLEAINFLDLVGSESVGTQDQSLPSSIRDERSRRGGAREGARRGRRESVSTSLNSQSLENHPQRLSREPWRYSRFGEWDASKWTDLLDRGGVRKIVHQ